MSECKSDIEVIGDVCEVSTEQYCTTFRTRDIGISAGNQIALLHSMLIDRDQRLAAAEAAARWLWPKVSDDAYDAAWEKWPWLDSESAKGGRDA